MDHIKSPHGGNHIYDAAKISANSSRQHLVTIEPSPTIG